MSAPCSVQPPNAALLPFLAMKLFESSTPWPTSCAAAKARKSTFFSLTGWQAGSIFPGSSPIGLPSLVFERAEPNSCSAIFGRPVMPIAPEAGV